MSPFQICEVSSGEFFVNEMFRKGFGGKAPEWGRHLVFFYRHQADLFVPLGYLNYLPHGEVLLVGGGVTNSAGFKLVSKKDSEEIYRRGGVFYQMLVFGFEYFADDCEAYFGYVGDPRAYEVDLKAGFVQTRHEKLVANFHKPISQARRDELVAEMHALGAF